MKKIISFSAVLGMVAPMFAFAGAGVGTPTTFQHIIETLIGYLNYIIPALITIAIIYFIWGVITYMKASDEEAKKMSRTKIINGIVGLFVIVAFWGIIGIIKNSFGVGNQTGGSVVPCYPTASENCD